MGNCCGPQKAYNEPPDEIQTPPSTADEPATPSGPLARDGPKSVVLACLDGPSDQIIAHLRAKPELEELRIEAASLGNVGASHVATELAASTSLRELTVAHCRVADRGCARLASLIEANPLTLIDLSGNRIGPEGVRALSEALRGRAGKLTLLLDENPLVSTPPKAGVAALADLCETLSTYDEVTLGLSACGLRFDGNTSVNGRKLLDAVVAFRSVDLSYNGLDDACALYLARQLRTPPQRLDLRHNPVSAEGERVLVDAWKMNGGNGRILALDAAPMNAPAALADVTVETFDDADDTPAATPPAPRVVVSAAKPARVVVSAAKAEESPAEPEEPASSPAEPEPAEEAPPAAPEAAEAPAAAEPAPAPAPAETPAEAPAATAEPAAEPAAAPPTIQPFKAKTSLKLAKLLVTFESGGGDLKKAFGQFDTNDDGHLAVAELHAALQGLGETFGDLSSEDVDACIEDFELDGDGVVSYDEFLAFARRGCEQLAAAGWAPPANEETKEAPETVPLSDASLRVGKVLKLYEDGGNPLRTAFDNFDVSKSGKLTVDELLEGLKGLGAAFENMTRAEVEKVVIDAFDKDPEGATVTYADFVGFVARARGQLDAAEA